MADTRTHRRDFYWKRAGWRWGIFTEANGEHGSLGMKFWREKTAALVACQLFNAYHDGRDVERESSALPSAGRQNEQP